MQECFEHFRMDFETVNLLIFYEIQTTRFYHNSLLYLSPFEKKDCIKHALTVCSLVLNMSFTITRLIER